jgi:RHS repeat-associated protein
MPTDHGFTGQIADSTSGLDYYGARYYDPAAGAFANADTVLVGAGRDPWGLSRYAYVEGNPEGRIDPTGHSPCEDKGICNSHDSYQVRTGAPCNTCEGGLYWNYIPLSYKIVAQFRPLTADEQKAEYSAIFSAILGASVSVGGLGPVIKGQQGEQIMNAALESEGLEIIATQVTIDTAKGTGRVDTIAIDGEGNLYVFDAKNGPNAGPTANQRAVYPELEQNGGTPRGPRANQQLGTRMGWTPGQRIDPVRVEFRYINAQGDSAYSSEPGDQESIPQDLTLDQEPEK